MLFTNEKYKLGRGPGWSPKSGGKEEVPLLVVCGVSQVRASQHVPSMLSFLPRVLFTGSVGHSSGRDVTRCSTCPNTLHR